MVKSGAGETLQAVVIGSLFNQLQHFLSLEIHCCHLNGRRREKKQNHHYLSAWHHNETAFDKTGQMQTGGGE